MRRIIKTTLLSLIACFIFAAAPSKASADLEIEKVLATTSHVPVTLMDVSNISVSTSTPGCDVVSYRWVDSYGAMSGWFSTSSCRVEIRVQAYDGYYFSENVTAYLNNESVTVTRDPSGQYIDFSREYAPLVWAPTVVKHPGGESVEVGGWASFVATATYTNGCRWQFVSPEGKYFNGDELKAKFPAVSVDENGEGKMKIYDIPAEMDGWRVICRFEGPGGTTDTNSAKITVKNAPAPTPSPEPTAEVVADESVTETEKAEAAVEEKAEDTEHVHKFSDSYTGDLMNHWQRCTCGETTKREQHDMQWEVISEATNKEPGLEKGICSVCGYSQTRETATKTKDDSNVENDFLNLGKFGVLVKVFLAIVGILGGFILIMYIRFKARRRKQRIKYRRY